MTDYLEEQYTEWIECRALMHAWEEIPYDGGAPKRWRITKSVVILELRCTRCGTIRYDTWSSITGALVDRTYNTPEGYALPKGMGRKVAVRKEYLQRLHRPKKTKLRRVV